MEEFASFESMVVQGRELNHLNVVRMGELRKDEDHAAVEMGWVRGMSVAEMDRAEMTLPKIRGWVEGVGDGLGYLHEKCGIVHRDVRADQVWVDGVTGEAKLSFPGLRKTLYGPREGEGEEKGRWQSPEQRSGEGRRCRMMCIL